MADERLPDRRMQARVFALTGAGYALYYFTRKNFSVVKKTLETEAGLSRSALGNIDTGFLVAYALGQFVWGILGDRSGPKRLLVLGLAGSAACAFAFGLSSGATAFTVFFALNGIAQSTGWPSTVKAMSSWYPPARRGAVMGLWSTNTQLGGLLGNLLAAGGAIISWRWAFFGPGLAVLAMAGAIALWLPARGPFDSPHAAAAARTDRSRSALASPAVWAVGLAYFFIKLTRYVLLFWLPYFMQDALGYPRGRAAAASLAFEAAGILGAIVLGWVSDRASGRLAPAFVSLLALTFALPLFAWAAPHGLAFNLATLALIGFCLYGPDTLLSGAVAQDLGGPAQAATAAGVIDGLGSLGPIAQGPLTAAISTRFGWPTLFSLLGAGAFASSLVVLALAAYERRRRRFSSATS
jgi:OPA family sugar phosphate sensor protein UhpC-like MFS transporter